ncbi:NAC domain-containing protein [Artemisia annua]|uniref:NAC domain-containing protein n=1 Tax=Artemisia annua TaxID=35608 RepID=A0A2U1L9W3_ARTAN|nr:NAC domain-containing protein [Artemisia annua]
MAVILRENVSSLMGNREQLAACYAHMIYCLLTQQPTFDYADTLEPGYRFCLTDPELIVCYLKPKIETGKRHPNCRYYDVNIYDYSPDELTAKPEYRSCENKWYFFTWTEQKHPNGIRRNRQTKNSGTWKASQTCAAVKDMTDWVLCKIYKKVPNQNANNNLADQEEAIVEQNHQLEEEPSPRRRRLSMADQASYQSNGPEHVQIQESGHHSRTDIQNVAPVQFMLTSNQQSDLNNVHVGSFQTFPTISMNTSPNSITMQHMPMLFGSNLIQPPFEDPPQALFAIEQIQPSSGSSTFEYYQNQSCPSSTENDIMTCPAPAVQMDTNLNPMTFSETLTDDVFQQDFQNSHHDTPRLYEEHPMVLKAEYSSSNPDSVMELENFLSFDPSKCISIDDLMDPPMDEFDWNI